jgi:PhnB protein
MGVNAYVLFPGTCKEAFTFYAGLLGGKIEAMTPAAGTPAEAHMPPDFRDKILHARMSIGNDTLMGSDTPPDQYEKPAGFSVALHIKDPAETERVFAALAEGGKVIMPLTQTFWAQKFGMLVDRYAIPWMVNCE